MCSVEMEEVMYGVGLVRKVWIVFFMETMGNGCTIYV